jgi:hypothetical protein
MALPVDTSKVTVLCGAPPQPLLDRETGQQRTSPSGDPMFRTDLIVLGSGRPEVIGVRTATTPKVPGLGLPLAVTGLTISTFTTKDGNTGVFYDAATIEPAKGTREAS